MVTYKGIEVNQANVKIVQEMIAPRSIREIQKLNRRVKVLSRFISQSSDLIILQNIEKWVTVLMDIRMSEGL